MDKDKQSEIRGTGVLVTEMFADDETTTLKRELRKCLVHLPSSWSSDNLTKFLSDQGALFEHAKKKKGMKVGFVTFYNVDQLQATTEKIDGTRIGNKTIKVVDVIPRSVDKKISSVVAILENGSHGMEPLTDENDTTNKHSSNSLLDGARNARDVVAPLSRIPYTEQLDLKKRSIMQILKKLTRYARKACPSDAPLPRWILNSRELGGLPCKLDGILESPVINGYRNKCEFSVGYSLKKEITVGFLLGNFRDGVTAVAEPVDCPNISSIACAYALIFQDFLRDSNFPIWNRFNNTGFWRQLTVREGRIPRRDVDIQNSDPNISEVMLIVQVCSKDFDDKSIANELDTLAHAFVKGARSSSPPLPLTSLVLQDHQGISNVAPPDAPLRALHLPFGENGSQIDAAIGSREARIYDHLCGLRFCISPTAFFQVNSMAAERLYSLTGDWANLDAETLLLDVCCGTGTIGLSLANHVRMVIGIEMNASAISDAQKNAEINGIKNCKFICGKAEDVLGCILKEHASELQKKNNEQNMEVSPQDPNSERASELSQCGNIVAIVDPPRGGLHPTVLKALRTHIHLHRLVYISCNPETLVANAIELCTPSPPKSEKSSRNNRGWRGMSGASLARQRVKSMPVSEPFRPVKAVVVDLFPHTNHCETVMLFER